MFGLIGVSKSPGAIAATLIPYLARSLAIGSTMPFIPPLLAPYAVDYRYASYAAILLINSISPLSPLSFSGLFLAIAIAAYFAT